MSANEVASKRIPVTTEIWESLSKLKRPGQTYTSLLEEMIAFKEEYDVLMHLEAIEKKGDFISLKDAAHELHLDDSA
jgi:predicted CopG family antitoxin